MPTFNYEAMSATGKPSKGTMEAASSEEVIQKLRSDGLFPTQVKAQKSAGKP
ncbi:MAG: type II secretion system F family protein, partial [Planctomycetes bacterium]|nr:type II secretion system F family protein [Planctomycetota bacterium]